MDITIPENILKVIGDRPFSINKIGMSKAQIICFDDMVLKIETESQESNNEQRMMHWLSDKIPVPQILAFEKLENTNYLLMSKVSGQMLCCDVILKNPKLVVKLLADGLRMLWNSAIDISDCPYNNSVSNKLKLAEDYINSGLCSMVDAEPDTYGENGFESPRQLLDWLKHNKPDENLILSHGDYCLPNIFTSKDRISGFIDLGRCGTADKYQDIALCYRSLIHNYDGSFGRKKYENFDANLLFDELQIVPDWDKIKYYTLLDELF